MGTLMQLLLEALKANVEDRNNELGPVEDQLTDQMSGFILENVQVATMPYIEAEEEELPNPLRRLVHNREQPRRGSYPQNIHKILDHLVRLEKKVKVLERRIPSNTVQQRLWLGATVMNEAHEDDSDYYPEEEDEPEEATTGKRKSGSMSPPAPKSKSPPRMSPKAEPVPSRVTSRPIRLEKEDRSCFARLLFSRCWTGRDSGAGWKIKRRCPTGNKASLSCPCGEIGPCRKVKGHPVPIDQMKSTASGKKGTKTTSSFGSKFSRKKDKHQKNSRPSPHKVDKPSSGKPLYEKLFPCCFKDHVHNDCCCRCKDNPPLDVHRKSKDEEKKSSVPKVVSTKPSAGEKTSRKATPEHESGSPSEEEGEEGSDYYDDQSEYQAYNIRSVRNPSLKLMRKMHSSDTHEEINRLSRKLATGDMRIKLNHTDSHITPNRKKEMKSNAHLRETDMLLPNKSAKSTTSFQIVLDPEISNDQIVEPEVVSHQILKTLSTIHGPVKVEQKIVVQGVKNSVIIVTHGEACQCNLCNVLKGKMHPRELVEGLSPQVVRISTDNGCNTLINHSDGCKCDLCRVLDPAITRVMEHRTPKLENENLVMAACSKSNENGSSDKPSPDLALHSNDKQTTPAELEIHENRTSKTHSLTKKSKCKLQNGKKKTKKCRCTKCGQRRRVEKLKLRLKKEMGTEEYNKIIREITRSNDNNDKKSPKKIESSVQSDFDDNDYVTPKRNKKLVSFTGVPEVSLQEDHQAYIGSNERRTKRCKLCQLIDMNAKQPNGIFQKGVDINKSWHSQNRNSNVYSMNASSHELPCEYQLKSKSKSNENGAYRYKSEEQKCFPPHHVPANSREKQAPSTKNMKEKVMKELSFFEMDEGKHERLHGSTCSGRCRRESPREEMSGHSAVLLQEGAFPQKFVYWAPASRSNVATAYSSESYYVPDQDEFPIVNMECEESTRSSTSPGGGPVQRVQIPVWFRMYPDRNNR